MTIRTYTTLLAGLFLSLSLHSLSAENTQKRSLAGNRKLTYLVEPPEVETFGAMFEQGVAYGRFRSNFFGYEWEREIPGVQKDNAAMGVGGSLIFKTGRYRGFSLTAGFYGTSNPFYRMDRDEIGLLKAGKDVLSRHEVSRGGSYHFAVLGEGTLNYRNDGFLFRGGRQIFESVFTASNDTKMIPNTFDGITVESRTIPGTVIRAAWLSRQKLRDHTHSHDVLTFRNAEGESWANQDDAGVHRGLSYSNFAAAGQDTENTLWILTGKSGIGPSLTGELSGLLVPEVLSNVALEAEQSLKMGKWSFKPAVRLMVQMDEGGGAIGGASLSGNVDRASPGGYTSPESLEGRLFAIRGVWEHPERLFRFHLGYTSVADKADLVAPWRAFPTGGYTRAMGQYNWRANTDSFMVQLNLDAGRLGWVRGLNSTLRYARMDFDETKGYTDRSAIHVDFTQKFAALEGLEGRFRMAFVDDDGTTGYNEYRLEFNYLF